MKTLLKAASERASNFIAALPDRPVAPSPAAIADLDRLGGPLPEYPGDPLETLVLLDEVGSPATVASAGPRYFGFVIGGSLPAALAANWLAGAWDQNSVMQITSPVAAKLEEIVLAWTLELLNLPTGAGGGFVTGTTAANLTALAAARTALLARSGWNAEEDGVFGAPPIQVVVGDEVHVSLLKALSILGLGRKRLTRVPVDDQGRMRADLLPKLDDRTLVCIQAGNVNTGAFDPSAEICARAGEVNAWVHIDGAFGLWAALSPEYRPLLKGAEKADSWAIDCHKWLNVPYDSGMAVVRDPNHLKAAMSLSAAYLTQSEKRDPWHFVPESSRRARGVELWAAMHSLGRTGLCELVGRNCRQARLFATRLQAAGFAILNEVVLNQVLISFGTPDQTRRIIAAIQAEGTCWCGGTEWQGHTAMRISVCNWSTTDEDVERSAAAMIRIAREVLAGS
jgi:glutamate/tyrosine decarboxylase-like PLP-dependent enzyme